MGIHHSMEQLSEIDTIKSTKMLSAIKKDEHSENSEKNKNPQDLFENGVNSTLVRKCLDAFTKNIDRLDKSNQEFYKQFMT